jgi:DHA2 family lincomycin resistance protein-like MFS transporter
MTVQTTDLAPAAVASTTVDAETTARNNLVINLLLVSAFVVILNETIMGVAIPPLMASLNVTASAAQWLTAAFLLTMAVVIPVTGWLLQRLHTRQLFLIAMTLFCIGTAVAAVAPGLTVLIIARIVQASGTAIMFPLLMTTVMTLVPPESRGKKMGSISIVISVAPAIGPVISGLILSFLNWRWMFILVLPIALGALWLGMSKIVNVTTPRKAPLDVLSVILSAFAFGGVVYGLSALGGESAGTVPFWAPLGVGVVAMAVFVARQLKLQRSDAALLDLRTFRSKNFTVSVAFMAILMMALMGTIIVLPIYLQNVLSLSTLQTGFLMLPGGLLMGLLGPPVGRQYDRIGPAKLVVPGLALVAAVLWAMTLMGPSTWVGNILIGHIVISVGFALLFTPLFTVSLSSVRPELYSHGSAVLGSIQQVGGAAGVALLVALMAAQSAAVGAAGASAIDALTAGIRAAFLGGAIIATCGFACVFFVRRPEVSLGH